ncbi:pilus assembly protein [Paraburkholderia sp.]|uniref:tetratricopeptide repeat protein n=1 Tax=Paraburkholderia sp. TaxID=1926495 RepID=UPI00286EB72D|nr:pilus assembly protein [Paraburkholderia sp.]
MKTSIVIRAANVAVSASALALLAACSSPQGYGVGPQAQAEMQMRAATAQESSPDTPGMYLGLISRMQSEGLYYASLAHIDAYERQYGASPNSIVLRADALRATGQATASASAYTQLLDTPFAARGHRGLGLLAGASGDFRRAAQELDEASMLAPTDPATLSDLGYALLREGDVNGARVPLLKAFELDAHNPKIAANVALLLSASGADSDAQALMSTQGLPAEARAAVARDAQKVKDASRARDLAEQRESLAVTAHRLAQTAAVPQPRTLVSNQGSAGSAGSAGSVASAGGSWPGNDAQSRLVQRLAQ